MCRNTDTPTLCTADCAEAQCVVSVGIGSDVRSVTLTYLAGSCRCRTEFISCQQLVVSATDACHIFVTVNSIQMLIGSMVC